MIVGFVLLPLAFAVWVLDRFLHVMLPQLDHKNFNEWLTNSSIIYAVVRLIMLGVLRLIFYWIFGF